MSIIPLTEDQKHKLVELIQSAADPIIRRARLILAYGEGLPTMQASMQAGISRGRARFWKRQFLTKGMGIFNSDFTGGDACEEPERRLYAPDDDWIIEPASSKDEEEESTGGKIPYPKPQKSIELQAEDNLAEAGRKVWLYHFAIMLEHEQGTRKGEDIEELHDMRVATRRMRSAFDVFGPAFDPKHMKRYLKGLRSIGRALGQVRDMDVLLEKALIYQGHLEAQAQTGMEALIGDWKRTIEKKRSKLIKHLESDAYQSFTQEFNNFLQTPMVGEGAFKPWSETTSRLRDIVPVLVYSRYAAVRAYDSVVPAASVAQLHTLRIEFKKFRYTLEYFKEILGESTADMIRELKQYQDHLGELHDADVACQLVRGFLKDWEENQSQQPIPERINPEPIVTYLAYLHSERYRLLVSFPELWSNFSRSEFRGKMAEAISKL
jgi:CHAD domain-containing protein